MLSVGRYRLLETLGEGGMGVVYKAFDPLLERTVAVKLIAARLDDSPDLRRRFFSEARAAGQLSHRNIVTIFDLGEDSGHPFFAMEFLEGRNLRVRMQSPEVMSLERKLEVMTQICDGLAYAHSKGITHRDIKPANVFITGAGLVKVLDFGLARLPASELTHSKTLIGTLNYMAPEQIAGEAVDHRTDIFAIGVVFYELLSSRSPFEADSVALLLHKILRELPPPLSTLDPSLPPGLVAIVDRAMAKAPEERYQSLNDLLIDLAGCRAALRGSDSASGARTIAPSTPGTADAAGAARPSSDVGREASSSVPPPPPGPSGAGFPSSPSSPAGEGAGAGPAGARRRPAPAVMAALTLAIAVLAATMWPMTRERDVSDVSDAGSVSGAGKGQPAGESANATQPAPGTRRPPLEPETATPATAPADQTVRRPAGRESGRREPSASARSAGPLRVEGTSGRGEAPSAQGPPVSMRPPRGEAEARAAATALRSAKAGAQAAQAALFAPGAWAAGGEAEAAALSLLDRQEFALAAARFYEASGLFYRAEVEARAEQERRAEQQRAAEEQQRRAEQQRAAEEQQRRAEQQRAAEEQQRRAAPVVPPRLDPPPAPAPPPPAPSSPGPPPEAAVRDALARYTAALESRSLPALRRVWPGLSGAQERAIREEFEHARAIVVHLADPVIELAGDGATVTCRRRYALQTLDGHHLESRTVSTITLKKVGDSWVIEQLRHGPWR